ncbi:MAG: T9SS type A sorting domain-containing protein [Saprospiraceae bacterium]|nr:T9SS type A sorting domain-containing protein [Saprospiraceae bacterium]
MKKLLLFICLAFTMQVNAQQLISYEQVGAISHAQMIQDYGIFIQYGVRLYAIEYTSLDLDGNSTNVSGLLVVPDDENRIFPRLVYQHGTVDSPEDVPSLLAGGYELAAVFGGMGYVTLAPDFLGLGVSELFHPYVHADSEAQVAIDMLFATEEIFDTSFGSLLNDQVFVTGYSQGGHAAMAAFQKLETEYADDYTVTAAAPMSGPYDISGAMTDFTLGDNAYYFPAYLAYTALSYQEAYGTLFSSIGDFFKPEFAPMIQQFYDREITLGTLNTFLINELTNLYGASVAKYSLLDDVLTAIETDPNDPINVALADNDVYDWTPLAPTRMFYCMADDQVTYQNSLVAEAAMLANGATDVEAVDVDPSADHGGCVSPAVTQTIIFFAQFQEIGDYSATADLTATQLKIAPNPTDGKVFITMPENQSGQADIRLLDLKGKTYANWQIENQGAKQELQLGQYPAGMYTLEIILNGQRFYSRLVIR